MFGQLLPSKNKIATVPNSFATGIRVHPNPVSKQGLAADKHDSVMRWGTGLTSPVPTMMT
jgi:hypothetical protein